MSFQYTYDAKGKPIGVFVPGNRNKIKILKSVEKGMKQVREIEKGKLKSIPLKQLLNALG